LLQTLAPSLLVHLQQNPMPLCIVPLAAPTADSAPVPAEGNTTYDSQATTAADVAIKGILK